MNGKMRVNGVVDIPKKGFLDRWTRVDELLEANVKLLHSIRNEIVMLYGAAVPAAIIPPAEQRSAAESGQYIPYDVKTFDMSAARENAEIVVQGNFLHIWTDGSYEGITIKLNMATNPAINIARRNSIEGFRFWKLYLTHTAQAGKTLDLFWGRDGTVADPAMMPLTDLVKLIPIAKADIFNQALPAAEADWLGTAITPTNSPSYLRIYTCVSVAGILRAARTILAATLTENLNAGADLVAGAAYMFTVPWRSGDSINIRYSVTAGTINRLVIDEVAAAE